MYPTPQDVLTFAGTPPAEGQDLAVVTEHLNAATLMVRAYTRGNGFLDDGPAEDLAAVIVSCAARLNANPTMDIASITSGSTTQPCPRPPASSRAGPCRSWPSCTATGCEPGKASTSPPAVHEPPEPGRMAGEADLP